MNVKQKLGAGLGTVALAIGAGSLAATAPAQAAPTSAQSVSYFYLVDDEGFYWPFAGDITRNLCINVTGIDPILIQNDTATEWYVFHTGTCNGSHAVIYSNPGEDQTPPVGYGGGSIHGIMRTSTIG